MTSEQDFHARAVEFVKKSCESPNVNKRNPDDLEIASSLIVHSPHSEAFFVRGIIDGHEVMMAKSFKDDQKSIYVQVDGQLVENQEEAQILWSKYGWSAVEIFVAEEQLQNISKDGVGLEV